MIKIIVTLIITAAVTSMFWIWFYGWIGYGPSGAVVETAGNVVTVQSPAKSSVAIAQAIEVGPAGLAIPVAGVKPAQLVDTFDAARSQGRRHDAIDIMANEGTPVISASDGTVEKLFNSVRGGMTIYVRSPDQHWIYYYAHLSAYAPGLHEGQQVRRGEGIARVGHSGDASAAGPHLHFAINQMAPGESWWNGTPINPYPLLAGKRVNG